MDVCGPCCGQKSRGGPQSGLPLAFMGKDASFAVILKTCALFFKILELIYGIYFKLIKIILMSFPIIIMENRFSFTEQLPTSILFSLFGA